MGSHFVSIKDSELMPWILTSLGYNLRLSEEKIMDGNFQAFRLKTQINYKENGEISLDRKIYEHILFQMDGVTLGYIDPLGDHHQEFKRWNQIDIADYEIVARTVTSHICDILRKSIYTNRAKTGMGWNLNIDSDEKTIMVECHGNLEYSRKKLGKHRDHWSINLCLYLIPIRVEK